MKQEYKVKVWKRDKFVCYYCGVDCRNHPTVDHVVPRSKGGSGLPNNLVTACYDCNQSKADNMPDTGTCIVKRAWQVRV